MNKQKQYDILGVQVDALTMSEALDAIAQKIEHNPAARPSRAFTAYKPYVEFMTKAHTDKSIQAILNKADLCLPDGVSLQWAASYVYGEPHARPSYLSLIYSLVVWLQKVSWRNQILPQKFAGITFTTKVLDAASAHGWRVGVIGGNPDIAKTKHAIMERWPELKLANVWSGYSQTTSNMSYDSAEDDEAYQRILAEIKAAQLDILFVGMGFPRQEMFIDHNQDELDAKVMIGEGGSFDYVDMGGQHKRAPRWVQSIGMEWLWRLILQPSRIKRQLAIPHYIWLVLRQAKAQWNREKIPK